MGVFLGEGWRVGLGFLKMDGDYGWMLRGWLLFSLRG